MKLEGVINVNKPADWTSQDVCAKLRGRLHIKRIGHTGTLDPMATGVLPVCIGNATKIIEYYDKDSKVYHAAMKLGVETDTLDITGEVLKEADFTGVSEDDIREAFAEYTGDISQIPPKYSAIRIDGQRAYDLARQGKAVDIKPRNIKIYSNKITRIDLEEGIIEYDVECSKGTYIRTMCDDIGHALGCGATMTSLERRASGMFKIKDAVKLEDLIEMNDDEIAALVIPADKTIDKTGRVIIADEKYIFATHGNLILHKDLNVVQQTAFDDAYRMYCCGEFIGIGQINKKLKGNLQPRKICVETD